MRNNTTQSRLAPGKKQLSNKPKVSELVLQLLLLTWQLVTVDFSWNYSRNMTFVVSGGIN